MSESRNHVEGPASSNSATVTESTPLITRDDSEAGVAPKLSRGRLILLFGTIYLDVILVAMDTTIVTTLMGHIGSDLKALNSVSWVVTGYTIAYSAFQPLYGKFSDIWGRKRISLVCTALFAIGCLLCGIAKNVNVLVFGRFVSGFGAGGVLSMGTITQSDYVPLRSRGVFQGIGNVCFGTGASLGGLFGGWMTDYGGWRLAFLAQVPLIFLCFLAQLILLKQPKVSESNAKSSWQRIDWVGSAGLVSSLLLFMLAVTTGGNQFKWVSFEILLLFVGSAALLYLFFFWETHRAIEPVMPISIVTHRTVLSACLTNFFGSGATFTFMFYTPLFLQPVYKYTYIEIGHRIVVSFIGTAVSSLGSGLIMRHTGKYYGLGLFMCVVLCVASLMVALIPVLPPWVGASALYQSLAYFLNGSGYSGMLTVTLLSLIAAVSPKWQATTTAAQYTFRGAGSSLGVAIAASVFQNTLSKNLAQNVGTDTPKKLQIIEDVIKSIDAIWEAPKKYQGAIVRSYSVAGTATQVFAFVWALLSLFSFFFVDEHDLDRSSHPGDLNEPTRMSTPPGPLEFDTPSDAEAR